MASGTRGSSLNAYFRVISGENSSWLGDFGRIKRDGAIILTGGDANLG